MLYYLYNASDDRWVEINKWDYYHYFCEWDKALAEGDKIVRVEEPDE